MAGDDAVQYLRFWYFQFLNLNIFKKRDFISMAYQLLGLRNAAFHDWEGEIMAVLMKILNIFLSYYHQSNCPLYYLGNSSFIYGAIIVLISGFKDML